MSCYNEGGSVSSDIPCNSSSSVSQCCGANWACLSNGLCQEHGTTAYSQGTCTDPTFQGCLSFCNQGMWNSPLESAPVASRLIDIVTAQFDSFTEVSRCDSNGNSWCCAGAAGQGLGGTDCCTTNLTTALEPYPLSTIDRSSQSASATTSAVTSISKSSTSSLSSITSASSTATLVPSTSNLSHPPTSSPSSSVAGSEISTTHSTTTEPTSSASPSPGPGHSSKLGVEIGVPVAIIGVLLVVLAFFTFKNWKTKKRLLLHLQGQAPQKGDSEPEMQEHVGYQLGSSILPIMN